MGQVWFDMLVGLTWLGANVEGVEEGLDLLWDCKRARLDFTRDRCLVQDVSSLNRNLECRIIQ